MIIVAKFASRCACCGQTIRPGDKIDWAKGTAARHAACAAGSRRPPKRAATSAPRRPRAPQHPTAVQAPEQVVYRRSTGRYDAGHDAGTTVSLPRVAGGGGPGGVYWTVIATGKLPPNEENDDFDWQIWTHVRPATDDEAAPVAERLEAKAAAEARRSAQLAELEALVVRDEQRTPESEARLPEGREYVIRPGAHGSGREVYRLTPDGRVARYHTGYYDDFRASLWTTGDARAVEVLSALLGGAS